ncbi:MAG TPA: HAMP domain-containing sensor histidine kinase [Thermoanaerobaculia bacterium]|nr:HAMP domain-containing sensor histidine kinase [Thermoanaerobaculia bacterium]
MARTCFMCGREISGGDYLCERCDRPRQARGGRSAAAPAKSAGDTDAAPKTSQALALDPFPAAPVVKFPIEAATPAITSIVHLLIASGVPSFLLGADRSVKFVSDAAMKLFDVPQSELSTLAAIEDRTGVRIGDLAVPVSAGTRIRERNILCSLVPLSGGAGGAVVFLRETDPMNETHASFVAYVRETVLHPLQSLRQSLHAAGGRATEPMLHDAAGTIEQVLSSLELAPGIDPRSSDARPMPRVTDIIQRVADRFVAAAALKGVQLQVDAHDIDERFVDHEQLSEALAMLMENALHYVPPAGMVVIGVRWMEHKNRPILLFFVMDNGRLVPEHLRQTMFEPSFVWSPAGERTGRALFKCREFAVSHGGSVWVESKTGKACTFFLRVRPDGSR